MDLYVGDIVTGNDVSRLHYSITNEYSICCILSMHSEKMVVLVIGHKQPNYIGYGYTVEKSMFKKIEYELSDYQKWLINEYGNWMYDTNSEFNCPICRSFNLVDRYIRDIGKQIKFDMPKTLLGYKVYKGKMIL